MKNLIKLPAIVLGLMLLITGTTQRVMAQNDDVSLQSFYDELSPYGTWIQDSQYGYVWRPDVEQGDFRPYYSNGRWAMTEYGNTWVSNYDWGWAPFHYGRWVYNRYSQWVWIPDTVWGPAWVNWRSGGGYYGWAPMGPGMNININIGIPDNWWVFIPQRNIYYDSFPRYYSRRNVTIIHNTTIINNTYERNRRTYYTGPRADDIRRATNRDVTVYSVNRTTRPGRGGITGRDVNIYNPRPSRNDRGGAAAPREVVQGDGYVARPGQPNTAGRDSRPGRGGISTDRGNTNTNRPDRGTPTDRGSVPDRNPAARPSGTGNPATVNPGRDNATPGRASRPGRDNAAPGNVPDRSQGTRPDRTNVPRESRPQPQQQPQARPIPQAQPTPQARPQPERRPDPVQQQQPQRAPQPQRQERPQPQQRTERPQQQSAPPERSSEGGGRSEGGRSSREGRG